MTRQKFFARFTARASALALVLIFPLTAETRPLERRALAPESLGVDREQGRLASAETKSRQQLIRDENCPLTLFFADNFDSPGEGLDETKFPAHCKAAHANWRRSFRQILEAPQFSPSTAQEIDKEEDYDDTANGRVRIDADGLAWFYEEEAAREETLPAPTYVVVGSRGERHEIQESGASATPQIVRIPARWKRSLLPQYSDVDSLRRYKASAGRALASEVPILEAPNADGPPPETR